MILTLLNKELLIDNVWAFRFQPSEPLTWTAGQYMRVELAHDNPDDRGTKRWFTISSAPYEGFLQITTRIVESSFKKALSQLNEGDMVQLIENPEGDFIWQDSDLPHVFVAGGIGVTPFYSILKQRVHDALPLDMTLVYNSRTPDVPFMEEFKTWERTQPGFSIVSIVGEPLSVENLTTALPALNTSLLYLSGPEPMVEELGDKIKENGLPESQLVQDFFPNYTQNDY